MPMGVAYVEMMYNYSSMSCSGASHMHLYLLMLHHRYRNIKMSYFWSLIKCILL